MDINVISPQRTSFKVKLRHQINQLLTNQKLKGKVIWEPCVYDDKINQSTQLRFLIAIPPHEECSDTPSIDTIMLRVLINSKYQNQSPIFILSNYRSSTYRELQLSLNNTTQKQWNLSQIIQNMIRYIESNNLDVKSLISSQTKVNLPNTVSVCNKNTNNKQQGFNISQNSCFSFTKKNQKEENTRKQSSSQSSIKDSEISMEANIIKMNRMSKKKTKPMKKNANLPKFLIRIFIKYMDKYRNIYDKKQFQKLYIQCKKMKQWKKSEQKQQGLGLKHLRKLFQQNKEGFPDPSYNRLAIIQIMKKYLVQQICQNSQIPQTHRLGYLVACRVYALRCRNSVLASRIQSK